MSFKISCASTAARAIAMLSALDDAWITITNGPCLYLLFQHFHISIFFNTRFEIHQFLALLLLNSQRDLATPIEEKSNFLEILIATTSGGHRWCANANTPRRECGSIAMHRVTVQ